MQREIIFWVVLVLANVPLYLLLGWVIFRSFGGFVEALKYLVTPDWFSLFQGRSIEDAWETMKLFIFMGLCAVMLLAEHGKLHHHEYAGRASRTVEAQPSAVR